MELLKTHKVFILFSQKLFKLIFLGLMVISFMPEVLFGQTHIRLMEKDSLIDLFQNKSICISKNFPDSLVLPIQVALSHYPELNNAKIRFVFRKQSSPLSAAVSWTSFFKRASKRIYFVSISSNVHKDIMPIQFNNLSFNSQIGVIGHELGHIKFFYAHSTWFLLKRYIRNLSRRSVDQYEFNTDLICIEHNLAFQLYQWSKEVRSKLNLKHWRGLRLLNHSYKERYMDPETILCLMKMHNFIID